MLDIFLFIIPSKFNLLNIFWEPLNLKIYIKNHSKNHFLLHLACNFLSTISFQEPLDLADPKLVQAIWKPEVTFCGNDFPEKNGRNNDFPEKMDTIKDRQNEF